MAIKEVKLKNGKKVFRSTVYIGINPATGKPKYKHITKETYKDVENELKRIAVDRLDNSTSKNDDITFNQAYNEWFESYKANVKLTTQESVRSKMKAVLPFFKHRKLRKINHKICQAMITDLAESGKFKRSSLMNLKMYTAKVFAFCEKRGYISKNPMKFVEIPKKESDFIYSESDELEQERKYWTKDEVKQFLEIALNELKFQDFVMFRILLFSGMRKGELHALHWNDVDFATGEVKIRKTLATIDGVNILQKPKTKASIRSIILDQGTLATLKKWKLQLQQEYIAFGNAELWQNNPPVFSDPQTGEHITLSHLNNVMDYNFYVHHPDFYKITIHQMRHTHASLLFESGASLKDVQAKLGHADIQTTTNIYTHVTETKRKKVLDDFADFMEI